MVADQSDTTLLQRWNCDQFAPLFHAFLFISFSFCRKAFPTRNCHSHLLRIGMLIDHCRLYSLVAEYALYCAQVNAVPTHHRPTGMS